MKLNLKIIFLVIFVSLLLALSYNYFSAGGLSLFAYDHKKVLTEKLLGSGAAEPRQIELKEAMDLYDSGVLFIDAREPEDYQVGHIKGSVNIPYEQFDKYEYKLKNISKDEPLVTYCSGTDCDLSIVLATQLNRMGYKQIFIFFGGWNHWMEAKYPTEKGIK